MILKDYTDDENIIIGALLHDTLEDTNYTLDQLKNDFGENIADIVFAVTEATKKEKRKMSWKAQKDVYLKKLQKSPKESLMISAADKIHNLSTTIWNDEPYKKVRKNFWLHDEVFKILQKRLDSPIVGEYEKVLGKAKGIFELNF